jgi:hypothetical protein
MLTSFDTMVVTILTDLSYQIADNEFCQELRSPEALQARRVNVLMLISWELQRVYEKSVVVLIDDYDSPMHSAIEHGYAAQVHSFILLYCGYLMLFQAYNFLTIVLGSLL